MTCEETRRYDVLTDMTREEWANIKATPRNDLRYDDQLMLGMIDRNDPAATYGFNDIVFEVVNQEGNPVEPEDVHYV